MKTVPFLVTGIDFGAPVLGPYADFAFKPLIVISIGNQSFLAAQTGECHENASGSIDPTVDAGTGC